MAVERLIGVDFGTSTSVIRVKRYENGQPIGEKLETKEVIFGGSGAMVPTLIMKKEDDASVSYFGYEAQQKKKKFTNFHSFKMSLESGDPTERAQARLLTEEFYAYLAKQYKSQSEGGHLGNPDDKERTIISYPVKWSEETKRFMLETAKKVGFPNVSGMDEAQAAIQAVIVMSTDHLQKYGLLKNGVGTNILLIDMGAGTTDLVLARYVPGDEPKTEVLNTWPKSGDIQFGGREIDNLLQNFFRGLLDEDDAELVLRRIGSDKFKSWKEETVSPALRKHDSVSDFEVLDSCVEMMGVDLDDYCLDRAVFENCLADYLKQFPELINGCLQNAGMSGGDVDLVIVTGGHSQWYFVNEMLAGKMPQFGSLNLPKIQENPARIVPISRPQETVALGLAYSGIHISLSNQTAAEAKKEPAEPVQDVQKEQPQPKKEEPGPFVMQIDKSYMTTETSRGTWVKGLVSEGNVRLGEKVFVCGGPGNARYVEVKEILLGENRKVVAKATGGDRISILLAGVTADEMRSRTHLSSVPKNDDKATVRTAAPEPFPQTTASDGTFLFELTFFGVQWHDPANRMIRVAGHVKGGQVSVGDTVYVCKPTGDPLVAKVEKIESVGLILDTSVSTAGDLLKKYLLTLSGVVADDFRDVKFLRKALVAETERKSVWEGVGDKVQSTFQSASDTVRQTAQKFEQQWQSQQVAEVIQDAALLQVDPDTIDYAPDNEFELAALGDNCIIRKYTGNRIIVSIPPEIRGRKVVAIGEKAFSGVTIMHGNKTLKMLIIPEGIHRIGAGAFAGCSNLKTVIAHDKIYNIEMSAFYGCNALQRFDFGMGDCPAGHVIFPPALQTIGASAFTRYAVLSTTACIFKEIQMSRYTKVNNMLSSKTFDPRYCAVFYYN